MANPARGALIAPVIAPLIAVLATGPLTLVAQVADTTDGPPPIFTSNDVITAGVFAFGLAAMYPIDKAVADEMQEPRNQEQQMLRRAALEFNRLAYPGSLIIGASMYTIGRFADNERMADLGLHGTEAILVGLGVAGVMKVIIGRARPYVDIDDPNNFGFLRGWMQPQYRSFPSGHSVAGFAAAAAVTSEAKRWWPGSQRYVAPIMFGGAALIGIARMYDNKHWASDVVLGAAIGSFAGWKIVRYHHTRPDNVVDDLLLGISITPSADGGRNVSFWLLPR
ncbi:MAG: phosphatase PAP2 family protein [Gemmatimonadaceae bacterium]